MRAINGIIVHGTATPPTMDIGVEEIRKWHIERGWSACGYHYVIRRDGTLELGRSIESAGAHTIGYNADSVGVALVGGADESGRADCNYTAMQYRRLELLVAMLRFKYGDGLTVRGHRDYAPTECPCFDVSDFFSCDPSMSYR